MEGYRKTTKRDVWWEYAVVFVMADASYFIVTDQVRILNRINAIGYSLSKHFDTTFAPGFDENYLEIRSGIKGPEAEYTAHSFFTHVFLPFLSYAIAIALFVAFFIHQSRG